MAGSIDTWRWLMDDAGRPLRTAAAEADATAPADVQRLRRLGDRDQVAAALQLASARRKAPTKFGERAHDLVADAEAVEQASSLAVARIKAQRFVQWGQPVVDLCSGLGGDALAFREAGLDVRAIDRDPARAWMTRQNADCPAAAADVTTLTARGLTHHIDPARRTTRGRTWRLADMQPGPDWLAAFARRNPAGAVKLSPAVDLDDLPVDGEVQFISESGRLVQAVLWTGPLQRAARTATLVEPGAVHELRGDPTEPDLAPMGDYLHAVDAAIERAGLLPMLRLPAVHPKLGLLTGDGPAASPWLTSFEVLDHQPYRPKKLKAWLAGQDAGIVEVKTRGKAVDPDREQAMLRGDGGTTYTVFILRWDRSLMATVTRRVAAG